MAKPKFKMGDLVECLGEGRGRFWRIATLSETKCAFLVSTDSQEPRGWEDFRKLTLATTALKLRIKELHTELRSAENELRAIEKDPENYVQPKSRKV